MPICYQKMVLLFTIIFFTFIRLGNSQTMNMPINHTTHQDTFSNSDLNGSGTSWLPESSTVSGIHTAIGKWSVMNHGSVYLRFTDQNANNPEKRGENAVDAPNWIMTMWDRNISDKNRLRLRGMLSLDPLTLSCIIYFNERFSHPATSTSVLSIHPDYLNVQCSNVLILTMFSKTIGLTEQGLSLSGKFFAILIFRLQIWYSNHKATSQYC